MEAKNSKVRQNLNTKTGKIAKISKGRSVNIVFEPPREVQRSKRTKKGS